MQLLFLNLSSNVLSNCKSVYCWFLLIPDQSSSLMDGSSSQLEPYTPPHDYSEYETLRDPLWSECRRKVLFFNWVKMATSTNYFGSFGVRCGLWGQVWGVSFVSNCHLLRIKANNDLVAVVCRVCWTVVIMMEGNLSWENKMLKLSLWIPSLGHAMMMMSAWTLHLSTQW
jgi:hypothetical protein